jgi:bifunctional non-homologous end joining protein LigD
MLVRMHGHDHEKQEPWLLIKERDDMARPASEFDVTEELPDSVLSNTKLPPAAAKKSADKASAKSAVKNAQKSSASAASKAAIKAATRPATAPANKRAAQSAAFADSATKRILESAPKAKLPVALAPQLATLAESPPTSGDWIYEIKFDGYRIVARIDGDDVRLFTRNGNDWTKKLTTLAQELRQQQFEPCWLDGEIVISDSAGRSDFQSLQNAFEATRAGSTAAIQYYVFDLPFYAKRDLRALPLVQRRAVLASVLAGGSSRLVRFSENFEQDPAHLLEKVCAMHLEGLIGKRVDAPYSSSRNRSWIKLKCQRRQEFVIGGYTDPKGARSGLGALLLGVYDASGKLNYAGNVGTGFTEATLEMLKKRLDQLTTAKAPFIDPPKTRGLHWVKPQLVGEVSFTEWTSENHLRHPVFHGLRADKKPESIKRETATSVDPDKPAARSANRSTAKTAVKSAAKAVGQKAEPIAKVASKATSSTAKSAAGGKIMVQDIAISHADRVIDASSGLTKGDLVTYYQSIAPHLLLHLKDRPVSMVRAPQGIAGPQMFQRHPDTLRVAEMVVLDKSLWPKHPPLIVLNSSRAIIGAAQMNAIELHTWNGTTIDQLEHPDRMVFDLDPGEGLRFSALIESTELTVGLLDHLGLKCFLKTSGGKGLHVVVPVARRYSWDFCRAFSEAVVRQLATVIPDRFVAKSGPSNRVGKVFVDFLRNSRGATTACAFSARARAGLGVSMTIAAAQLKDLDSGSQWNIKTAAPWVKKRSSDPWADYPKAQQQRLEAAALKLGMKVKA